jgi:spermidine/putrescine transport system permease protein
MSLGHSRAAMLGGPLGALLIGGVLVPAAILFVYSFFGFSLFEIHPGFHLDWYRQIVSDGLYRVVVGNTLAIAVPTTIACVVGGYMIAYYIAVVAGRSRGVLLMLVVVSLLASYLARVYAWRTLMGDHGIVNSLLQSAGVIEQPIGWLLFSRLPVILAEINLYMPVTALICYASLTGIPGEVREAARDLGAGRLQTLWRITLPLSGPALFGSAALAFFLSCGDYITPAFLGGPTTSSTLGTLIFSQITTDGNYPLSAALSFSTMALFFIYALALFSILRGSRLLPRGDER